MFDLQKASMWKRLSAGLFDLIMFSILAVGFAFIMTIICQYDAHYTQYSEALVKYETQYGISFDITEDDYNALTEEDRSQYDDALAALNADTDALIAYNMVINLSFIITSLSILLAYLVWDFIMPLIFKNGQTLGKRIFSICLMRTDGIKVTPLFMFIRTILGKFTLETMIPALILLMMYFSMIGLTGTIVISLIVLLQLIMIIATNTNSLIHDLLAGTVVVDMQSQFIFDSKEALFESTKQKAAEEAEKKSY